MRKILLTLALVFASAASYAQTEWYVQANLSLNKYTYDTYEYTYEGIYEDIDVESSRMPGYEALVGFFKPMGSDMFLWGMNLGVANRGGKYADVKESRFMAEFSPFDFNSRIQIGSSPIAVNPHVGLNFTFDIFGNYKVQNGGKEYEYDVFDDFDDANRFDVGLNYGVRVWFVGKTFFDFTVKQGFIKPWDYEIEGKSNRICLGVGYSF